MGGAAITGMKCQKKEDEAAMKPDVLIGSSIPPGEEHLRSHKQIRQGDIILTSIPEQKEEALAVARYCRENNIYLVFSEFLQRPNSQLTK